MKAEVVWHGWKVAFRCEIDLILSLTQTKEFEKGERWAVDASIIIVDWKDWEQGFYAFLIARSQGRVRRLSRCSKMRYIGSYIVKYQKSSLSWIGALLEEKIEEFFLNSKFKIFKN